MIFLYECFNQFNGCRKSCVTLRAEFLQFNYLVNSRRDRDCTTLLTRDDAIVTRCDIMRVQMLLESSFALF